MNDTSFSGILYHEHSGAYQQKAQAVLEADVFVISLNAHDHLSYDLSRLFISWNGTENDQLIVSVPEDQMHFYARMSEAFERLDSHPHPHIQMQMASVKKALKRRWGWVKITGIAAVSLVLVGLLLWQMLTWLWQRTLDSVPVSWEINLGKELAKETLSQYPPCQNPALKQSIDTLGKQLAQALPNSPYPFQFYVVQSEEINAFALPGGQMFIHTALIHQAESPEQVAGVMAHEMAHVLKRHGLQGMARTLGLTLLVPLVFGDMGTLSLTLAGAGAHFLNLNFSRSQETEADLLGLEMMQKSRINPKGMVDFFGLLSKKHPAHNLEFMSTHPLHDTRIDTLSQQIKNLPRRSYPPVIQDWSKIRQLGCAP